MHKFVLGVAALVSVICAACATASPMLHGGTGVPAPDSGGVLAPDKVLVVKHERMMYLLQNGMVVRSYRVALGRSPVGHKVFQGDGRTPEGLYLLDGRNSASRFYRSMHISYPNSADAARAAQYGSSAGGLVMIHGQPNDIWQGSNPTYDWTEGCIAVSNREMDEVWALVQVGTPIEILP
jgi:murein L,D-transpeptidase YafK